MGVSPRSPLRTELSWCTALEDGPASYGLFVRFVLSGGKKQSEPPYPHPQLSLTVWCHIPTPASFCLHLAVLYNSGCDRF